VQYLAFQPEQLATLDLQRWLSRVLSQLSRLLRGMLSL
jgi:hypothetical protein